MLLCCKIEIINLALPGQTDKQFHWKTFQNKSLRDSFVSKVKVMLPECSKGNGCNGGLARLANKSQTKSFSVGIYANQKEIWKQQLASEIQLCLNMINMATGSDLVCLLTAESCQWRRFKMKPARAQFGSFTSKRRLSDKNWTKTSKRIINKWEETFSPAVSHLKPDQRITATIQRLTRQSFCGKRMCNAAWLLSRWEGLMHVHIYIRKKSRVVLVWILVKVPSSNLPNKTICLRDL